MSRDGRGLARFPWCGLFPTPHVRFFRARLTDVLTRRRSVFLASPEGPGREGLCSKRLWPTFGGDRTWLAEQDAVTEESEPGATVHLPFEELGLGIDAFGTAVMERQAERGDYRIAIID